MASVATEPGELKANVPTPQIENKNTELSVQHPNPNAPAGEKAASGLTTLSSSLDPYPHYFMAAVTGAGAAYSYQYLKKPRIAAVTGFIAAAYAASGYLVHSGKHHMGYNIATLSSLGLLATSGPSAFATKDVFNVAMTAFGTISTAQNAMKCYQLNTGEPKDLKVEKNN